VHPGWNGPSRLQCPGSDVVNATGDQFSLLCEALPGDRSTDLSVPRQPLYTIAGASDSDIELGDRSTTASGWIGPYSARLSAGPVARALDPLLASRGTADPIACHG